MTSFDFGQNRQQVEKQFNLGKGEYFKVKEGANKIRLVSKPLPHPGNYKGKETFKWLCQVIDLSDLDEHGQPTNKVKPYFMPHRVYKDIEALQKDPDYAFDEIPMPYNINIQAEHAGSKEVKYTVIPSPKRISLTMEELKAIESAPTVEELQAKIWESEKNAGVDTGSEQADEIQAIGESIPF
jgi:hypothetical protein